MISSIPGPVLREIESLTHSPVKSFSFAGGGCINRGGKVVTDKDQFFVKWNRASQFPGMFGAEAQGLSLLAKGGPLKVPHVVVSGVVDTYQFLLLELIEEARKSDNYWEVFGSGLGTLHKTGAAMFGLDHDNYIGSLPQKNNRSASWTDFFIEFRLGVQLRQAIDKGLLGRSASEAFARLFKELPNLLPEEPPSLLHGDLWSGNVMTTARGLPCLIDPAVYFGNREADLAMTQLFGGFDPSYLQSYNEVNPIVRGFGERVEIYNLYPLLVHANLFGGGYPSQVMSIVGRYE